MAAFAKRSASADGKQGYCRTCVAEWARAHRPRKLADPPEVPVGHKWCRRCDQTKPTEEFASNTRARDGLQTYCRSCGASIYRTKREQAGHLVRPADVPEAHKFCRTCGTVKPLSEWSLNKSASDGYQTRCKECARAAGRREHLSKAYGLTTEDVAELIAQQNGICVICLRSPAVHVDHDHATGEVRGMLCFPCNAALGQLDDDLDRLRRAADYLEGRKLVMRRTHPGVVEITYPEPARSSPPARRLAPPLPPIDIARLRQLARLARGRHAG